MSNRKEFIVIPIRWDADGGHSFSMGMVIFQENNKSFKWGAFAKSWELLRPSQEKRIKSYTETVYLEVFHAEYEL